MLKRVLTLALLAAALTVIPAGSVSAAPEVIGYEGFGFGASYTESGFVTSVNFGTMQATSGSAGSTRGMYPGFSGQTVTIGEVSGAEFSLTSIDFAVSSSMAFNVVGTLAGGGTVTKLITQGGGTPSGGLGQSSHVYETFSFGSGFENLVSVSFVQGSFPTTNTSFDNVVVELVVSDTDGDGVHDDVDNCVNTPNPGQENNDGDVLGDACDPDDDNDGTPDVNDAFPFDPTEDTDTDGDGTGNNADTDDDDDGQLDAHEVACGSDPLDDASLSPDFDGDSVPDCVDEDDDNDGATDGADMCALTVLPEPEPESWRKNRYIADASGNFVDPNGREAGVTVVDTYGCSGAQIIEATGLPAPHTRFGITKSALLDWVANTGG